MPVISKAALLAHAGQEPFSRRRVGPMARLDRQARSDKYEKPDNIEPALAAEPTENTEATEPAEPIDRIDPAEPMDRIEPLEPIDRIEPLDPMLSRDPAEPAVDASRLVRMITFSQHGPVRNRAAAPGPAGRGRLPRAVRPGQPGQRRQAGRHLVTVPRARVVAREACPGHRNGGIWQAGGS
jgi:hypothetical protein